MSESINKKHYSLVITFSVFIVIMASLIVFSIIYKDIYNDTSSSYDFSKIETINPFLLESSNNVVDKTNANIALTNEIKRVFNIDVVYGEGTEQLSKTIDAAALYDETDINGILLNLIDCLNKYPNNIFKEIQMKGYDVEICILDHFDNDNIALATRDSNNNFKIYLSNVSKKGKIMRSIHHEMYHILEYYMKLEFDIDKLYKDWNSYNPPKFEYQNNIALLNTEYVYGIDKDENSYFVSIYSKSSDKEDKAEVFADTMIAESMPGYYTISNTAIKNKMKLISDAIKQCFYSVNFGASIYWMRYF